MTLTTKQLEHFYKVYELNPMSTIMTSLMGMTNNDFNKSIELMEQIEDYINKKELNEI